MNDDELFAHVDHDLAPGDTVGEYRIEAKIGQGGFGAVYRAVHPLIGKTAAVKLVNRELSKNPQMVSRFVAEARAVNQIRHRNIIDIFSFGQLEDGRHYYVMELLEGVTFDKWLAGRTPMALDLALPILKGIARAMDAAHAKGILHRDLKPENVFVVSDDDGPPQAKLLDFGLAKLVTADPTTSHHKTETGTPMGTPYYMSPEQCRGQEVDARTDVYAFGAMCFEVLTGTVPFDGDSAMDVLCKHLQDAPPSASERAPGVSIASDAILARMMAKAPQGRPATIGEALDLLCAAAGVPPSQKQLDYGAPVLRTSDLERAKTISSTNAQGQTFLASEADVPAPRTSRLPLVGIAAAIMLALGVAGGVVMMRKSPAPIASGLAQPPPSVAALTTLKTAEPEAPRPKTAQIQIEGLPSGAAVTIDGSAVDAGRALEVVRGKTIEIVITAKGFKSKTMTLTPETDTTLPITLEKAPKAAVHRDLETF